MIYIYILTMLISTSDNECIKHRDKYKFLQAVSLPSYHIFLTGKLDLPLGIYEKINVKNTPYLYNLTSSFPAIITAVPDKKGSIPAAGLMLDGAYFELCRTHKDKASLKTVQNLFFKAAVSPSATLRRAYLAYALFETGRWAVSSQTPDGPMTRIRKLIESFELLSSDKFTSVYIENKSGQRKLLLKSDMRNLTSILKSSKKIIIVNNRKFRILPVVTTPSKLSSYPAFLKPFIRIKKNK